MPVVNCTVTEEKTEDMALQENITPVEKPVRNESIKPTQESSQPEKMLTFKQKLASFKNNITVEPVAFLMLSASILGNIGTQNLGLEKACRVNLNLGEAVCDALKNQDSNASSDYEREVQQYVAYYINLKTIITSVLPGLILVFVGGWMDKTGRRIVIMTMPIIGEILQNLSNILNVVFFNQLSVEYLIFPDAFFGSFAGGWSVMFLAVFSYIADITTEVNRTHRLGLVSFCTYVGLPIGLAVSGIILKNFGYYAIYGTSMAMHIFNLLYVLFVLKDPARTTTQKLHDRQGFCYILKTFFDPTHIKDTLKVVFKKTSDNRRLRLCILLGTVCILFGPMYGEMAILYMSTRYRFNWDEVNFSVYQTYNFVTHTIGIIFSIMVFSKKLQWHDSMLGIISTLSKISASFIYCFARIDKIFYIGPVIGMFSETSLLAIRSIFSKMVAPDELGKVNSIVGIVESLLPLMYVPLYTNVYTATMEVLPGAVFLMGASMTLLALFVFIWLFCRHKKSQRINKNENGTEMQVQEL